MRVREVPSQHDRSAFLQVVKEDPIQVGLWSWVIGSGVVLVITVVVPTLMEVLL